jgi:hypothetical protein
VHFVWRLLLVFFVERHVAVTKKYKYLIELLLAHFAGHGMYGGVAPKEAGAIVVYLNNAEIGNAVFGFCKDAVASGTVCLVEYFAFFAGFHELRPACRWIIVRNEDGDRGAAHAGYSSNGNCYQKEQQANSVAICARCVHGVLLIKPTNGTCPELRQCSGGQVGGRRVKNNMFVEGMDKCYEILFLGGGKVEGVGR